MLRRRSIELGLWMMAAVAPMAAAGCTDDGAGMHIECNVAPEISGTGCTWSADGDSCVFDGRLNVRAATSYYAGFSVRSGLKPRVSRNPPRSEPNGVQLQEAQVELRTPGGRPLKFKNGLVNPYTLASSGYVEPGGVGLLQVELVPPAYVRQLRDQESDPDTSIGQIVAVVKARGITDGQVAVETSNFYWPIRLLYKSPVVSDGECYVAEAICSTLRGVDGFADACLCPTEDGSQTDRSCDLEKN